MSRNSDEIPHEIKDAISALDDPIRWRIVENLLEKNELSYTEILNSLKISKGKLSYHLAKMTRGALLEKFGKNDVSLKYDSYYCLSSYGNKVIFGLMTALAPAAFPTSSNIPVGRKQPSRHGTRQNTTYYRS